MPASSYQCRGNLEHSKQLAVRQSPSSVPLLPLTLLLMPVSYTSAETARKWELDGEAETPEHGSSVQREYRRSRWRKSLQHAVSQCGTVSAFCFCFQSKVRLDYIFGPKNALWISNYLPEEKRSVSLAHSTSLMYCALIPVNSLAKTDVHMWKIKVARRQASLTRLSDMEIDLFSFTLHIISAFFCSLF